MGRALNDHGSHRQQAVELVGPAGSGKTTVCARLMARDPTIGPGLLHPHTFDYAVAAWRLLLPFARLAIDRDLTLPNIKCMLYLEAIGRMVRRQRHAGGYRVLLIDEGPVYMLARMRLWQTTGHSSLKRWRRRTVAWWSHELDFVVALDAPNEVLVRRIRERSAPPPIIAPDDALSSFLTRYRAWYDEVLDHLADWGDVRVARIATGDVPLEDVAAAVGDLLAVAKAPTRGVCAALQTCSTR